MKFIGPFRILILALPICIAAVSTALGQTDPADPTGQNGVLLPGREESEGSRQRAIRNAEVITLPNRRVEFVAIGPQGQATAAAEAIASAGGRLLRARSFPVLGRQALIFDLGNLTLPRARQVLAQAAPQTTISPHNIYRFAQGTPRLYAARMLGIAAPGSCRLTALRIGMIDGPVDASHPSLRTARVTVSSVLTRGEKAATSDHGTAVAALIVGQDADGALAGFANGAHLFAVTTFAREKRGPGTDVERIGTALEYLLANRVQLINMSFAGPPNAALDSLLDAAARRGALMIAAAGNDRQNSAAWPAAAPSVIAVTAVDAAGRRYRAANTGTQIEFAAPGVDLYVAKRRGGTYASGTSYAAPIITALAARLVVQGARTTDALRARLRRQASDLGIPGRDSTFGWGLVRAPDC